MTQTRPAPLWLNANSRQPSHDSAVLLPRAQPSINPQASDLITPHVETIALDVAETGKLFQFPGNLIIIPWATDSTVLVGVTYHDISRHEPIKAGKNWFRGGFRFNQFFLSWSAQAGKSIQIEIYDDPSTLQQIRVE